MGAKVISTGMAAGLVNSARLVKFRGDWCLEAPTDTPGYTMRVVTPEQAAALVNGGAEVVAEPDRPRRLRTNHPGVRLLMKKRKTGHYLLARWDDPKTGRSRQQSLSALGIDSWEAGREWAVAKSAALQKAAQERSLQ